MRIFRHVEEWFEECERLIDRDLDDIILLTGAEGSGKSTLAFQLAKRLDSSFNLESVGFSVNEYMDKARALPRGIGRAVMADEFLVNRRKAMRRETVDLMDFLQECRGLNLHHIICFPHADLLDRMVMDYRVRWHVHVPRRGLFQVKERVKFHSPTGEEQFAWRIVGQWKYGANKGSLWESYQERKLTHMSRSQGKEGERPPAEGLLEGWDLAFISTLPGRYEEACRPTRLEDKL